MGPRLFEISDAANNLPHNDHMARGKRPPQNPSQGSTACGLIVSSNHPLFTTLDSANPSSECTYQSTKRFCLSLHFRPSNTRRRLGCGSMVGSRQVMTAASAPRLVNAPANPANSAYRSYPEYKPSGRQAQGGG